MVSRSRTTQQQTQQQTQTQQLDPAIRDAFLGTYNRAVGVANNLGERQFADFNADQQAAFAATRNAVNSGNNAFGAANNALTNLLDFRPERLGPAAQGEAAAATASQINRGDIRDVTAERLRDTDLSAYINPFTTGVIDTSLADLERSRQMQRSQDAARAAKAGAFGGSRQAVLEAETNRAFDDNAARTVAGLRSSAFENAQRAAMGDIGNQMAAQQANQGVDLNVGSTNASLGTQTSIANAGNATQASLANAASRNSTALANAQMGLQGAQLGLSAAGQLGQLGALQQNAGLQGAEALGNAGALQQMLAQQRLDSGRNLGMEQLGVIRDAVGLLDPSMGATVSSSGSSSGTSTQRSGGLGQAIGLGMQGFALLSDERVKEDIEPVGGGLYSYRMKGTGDRQVGVLAQEVEKRDPGAVVEGADGLKRVNYTRATGGLLDGPIELPRRRKKKGKK